MHHTHFIWWPHIGHFLLFWYLYGTLWTLCIWNAHLDQLQVAVYCLFLLPLTLCILLIYLIFKLVWKALGFIMAFTDEIIVLLFLFSFLFSPSPLPPFPLGGVSLGQGQSRPHPAPLPGPRRPMARGRPLLTRAPAAAVGGAGPAAAASGPGSSWN